MSLLPKSEWTDWAGEWAMQHLPQKGWLYRNEGIVGTREGRLVQVGWGGEHHTSLVVLIRFPRVENVGGLRDALIADPILDGLPGKGAKRCKMGRETGATTSLNLRGQPEFMLGESSLRWVSRFPWASPKSATVRAWVEMLFPRWCAIHVGGQNGPDLLANLRARLHPALAGSAFHAILHCREGLRCHAPSDLSYRCNPE